MRSRPLWARLRVTGRARREASVIKEGVHHCMVCYVVEHVSSCQAAIHVAASCQVSKAAASCPFANLPDARIALTGSHWRFDGLSRVFHGLAGVARP